ncbi:MAG: SPOR domain-containing protein [Gammaproteobacteria bacterium]
MIGHRLLGAVCATLLASLGAEPCIAAPAATVTGLQMPAWVVRGGAQVPLAIGAAVGSGDTLRTGAGSRVLLTLEEGSTVKLGESATLDLARLAPPPQPDGVFEGVMNVLAGAFRFTTTAIGQGRKRNLSARIGTATIGIRGTDVWGKAEPGRDFIVLLEGTIDVTRDDRTVTMAEPQSLFMAPRGAPALPLAPVDPGDLARWAQETELQPGAGFARADGRVRVYLASFRNESAARAAQAALAEAGYAANLVPATVRGRPWHRLAIDGFVDRTEAQAFARAVAAQFAFASPWFEVR